MATPARQLGTAAGLAKALSRPMRSLRAVLLAARETGRGTPVLDDVGRRLGALIGCSFESSDRTGDLADVLVQMAALGLTAEAVERDETGTLDNFARDDFLARCLDGLSSASGGKGLVGQLEEILRGTRLSAVKSDLERRFGTNAPLAHFYEELLSRYDASARRSHGAYFTPDCVADYLTRSLDVLLRSELNVSSGLAACTGAERQAEVVRLRVVDPACGSGAILSSVLAAVVRDSSDFASLPGLIGFEIMPGACAAAQWLLRRQLGWDAQQAVNVRVMNPLLEDESIQAQQLGLDHGDPVLAIVGNPPYANYGRRNRGRWILNLLQDYKAGLEEKKHNLNDDFIKFIRWGQYWIERAGRGVLAFITNGTYLTGVTHRRMRQSLMETFDDLYFLDLHGDSSHNRASSSSPLDENLFDIATGVAIGILVKRSSRRGGAVVRHAELVGTRLQKHAWLSESHVGTTNWRRVHSRSNQLLFTATQHQGDSDELSDAPRLDEVFDQYVSGVQTKCDAVFVAFTRAELAERMQRFLRAARRNESYESEAPRWLMERAVDSTYDEAYIQPYFVSPFDRRWIYYAPRLLGRARYGVLRHVLAGSPALVFMRQSSNVDDYDHLLMIDGLASDRVFYSRRGAPFLAPLWLADEPTKSANLNTQVASRFASRLGLPFESRASGSADSWFGAEDVFHYIYALLHSPSYRSRYRPELRREFPRTPITSDRRLFRELCRLGRLLMRRHLLHPDVERSTPAWDWTLADVVRGNQPPFSIDPEVWSHRIGGYPVLPRWWKQRRGRTLDEDEQRRLHGTIVALSETRALTRRIDDAIGGWPLQ